MRRIGAFALCAAMAYITGGCSDVSLVDRVVIANPHEYEFQVDVGDGRGSWLPLGLVHPKQQAIRRDVIEMGARWVFRFRFRDLVEERVELTRIDLERASWRVEVPAGIAERLRRANEPPSF